MDSCLLELRSVADKTDRPAVLTVSSVPTRLIDCLVESESTLSTLGPVGVFEETESEDPLAI